MNHCCYRCFQFKVCILSYIRFTLNRTAVSNALNTIWIGFKIKSWDHYEYGRIIMTDPMICEEELSLDLAKACEFRSGSFCLQKGIFSTTLFSFNIWIKYIFTQKSNLWKKSSESKYYRLKNPPFPMGTGKFKNSVFTNIPILYNNLLQKWVTTSWTYSGYELGNSLQWVERSLFTVGQNFSKQPISNVYNGYMVFATTKWGDDM